MTRLLHDVLSRETHAGEEGDWNMPNTQKRYVNLDKKTENLARIISNISSVAMN